MDRIGKSLTHVFLSMFLMGWMGARFSQAEPLGEALAEPSSPLADSESSVEEAPEGNPPDRGGAPTPGSKSATLKKKSYGPSRRGPIGNRVSGTEGQDLETEPLLNAPEEPASEFLPVRRTTQASGSKAKNYSLSKPMANPGAETKPVGAELSVAEGDSDGVEEQELKTEPLFVGTDPVSNEVRSFHTALDRSKIHLDESFTLLVEIVVPDLQPLTTLDPPEMEAFSLINRYQSDVISTAEKRVWKVRRQQYVYVARAPGNFTIPPAMAIYQGRRYRTPPLAISVEGARSGFAVRRGFGKDRNQSAMVSASPEIMGGRAEQNDFSATLSAAQVYVNQQVLLKIQLQFVADRDTKVKYSPPALTGFITETLPQTNAEENVSGSERSYITRHYCTALFPIQSGSLTIGAGQVRFFAQDKERTQWTEPLALTVLSLPPDPQTPEHESENRLVGQYQLSARLESRVAEVNAPLHLTLQLSGEGNIREAPEPVLTGGEHFRAFLEDRRERIALSQEAVTGERSYRYLVVFDQAGVGKLGRAVIRYFNPVTTHWESAETDIPEIKVSARPVAVSGSMAGPITRMKGTQLLRPNHGGRETLRPNAKGLFRHYWFWLLQAFGPLLLAGVYGIKKIQERLEADPQALRLRRAYPQFRKNMQNLTLTIETSEMQAFYAGITRAVSEYLAARLGVAPALIGAEKLPDYFSHHQVPDKVSAPFISALTACEYVRYAAVVLPAGDMRALHSDLCQTVAVFEAWWTKAQARKLAHPVAIGLGLLLMLATLHVQAGDTELSFWRGNAFAERGDYASAEAEYGKVIADHVHSADVEYNLGNVYLKQGKLGPAILAYERGLRLAPRDKDLKYNLYLATATALIRDPTAAYPNHWSGVIEMYRVWTGEELAWAATAVYYLVIVYAMLLLLWPKYFMRWRYIGLAVMVLAVLLAGWSAARAWEPKWWKRAVVLAPQAEVYVRPYPRADVLFSLPEGSRVEIQREEEVWVEVQTTRKRQGWIERSALGMID